MNSVERYTAGKAGQLTVAVVGSGPAACYAAEELLSARGLDVRVNMFERLTAPGGLARYGVAPDHLATRDAIATFEHTMARSGFSLHLNVEVGVDITHEQLMEHHHAVLYAHGCAASKSLGLPGEEMPGSHPVRDFVGWYNGHPDHVDHAFNLSHERAVVIGNGNVALDVARILTSGPDRLASSDIAPHALEALTRSNIREVMVLGRRGPEDAAFTTAELIGLSNLADVDIRVENFPVGDAVSEALKPKRSLRGASAIAEYKLALLQQLSAPQAAAGSRTITLRFLSSPEAVLGDLEVRGIRVVHNELRRDPGRRAVVHATGKTSVIDCGMVLQSVGYVGSPLPGLPFDIERGVVPNNAGRVASLDPAMTLAPGSYVAGWIKRGPSGVMGTNKQCARETVSQLLDDYAAGRLKSPNNGGRSLAALLNGGSTIDFAGWQRIDAHERSLGIKQGRPRVKLVDRGDMVRVAMAERVV